MIESQSTGVQKLPLEAEIARYPIDPIAGHGKIDRREMDADLMRSPSLEANAEKSVVRQQLEQLEVGDGLPGLGGIERAPGRLAAIAADRRLDRAST